MAMQTSERIGLGIGGHGSYEEFITRLIFLRNELEALIESWPDRQVPCSLAAFSRSQQEQERLSQKLKALALGYEQMAREWARLAQHWMEADEQRTEPRPAGLPAVSQDGHLERSLLAQVEQLLAELKPAFPNQLPPG